MRVTIVDYGIGNLHSISKGLEMAGARTEIVSDMTTIEGAECVVFPGVGAFGEAMEKLEPVREMLLDKLEGGLPVLGICLGLQLMFESSEESPDKGIGFIQGTVRRLDAERIPQMGWNDVIPTDDDPIFDGIPSGTQFYFANSYACYPDDAAVRLAETVYGRTRILSVARRGNSYGVQFHPEKSSAAGLRLLKNFVELSEGL